VLSRPREPYTRMLMAAVPSMIPPRRLPATGAVTLQTQSLHKTYGKRSFWQKRARVVNAVNDVTLQVRRGETLGIVGESGSGKSTVARCIARLVDPTSGKIAIEGRDIAALSETQMRPLRRGVQMVFQDPYRSLNPRRTVGEAIIEGPMNFARALAMEPYLLIGDEPVSALDVSVQAQVLKLLDEVRRQFDLAVLFITHDLRIAAQVCDRLAVMQKGIIVEQGATADVFANPKHPYTRALFEAAPGRHQEFGRGD
jgi:peptide/nickel transport system ATP-binding protein